MKDKKRERIIRNLLDGFDFESATQVLTLLRKEFWNGSPTPSGLRASARSITERLLKDKEAVYVETGYLRATREPEDDFVTYRLSLMPITSFDLDEGK